MDEAIQLSPSKFRLTGADVKLVENLSYFARQMLSRECYHGVLCSFIVSDMIQVLIRVDYLSEREIDHSYSTMTQIRRLICHLLPEEMFRAYVNCIDYVDPMIENEWRQLIERMRVYKLHDPPNWLRISVEKHQDHGRWYHFKRRTLHCDHRHMFRPRQYGERAEDFFHNDDPALKEYLLCQKY